MVASSETRDFSLLAQFISASPGKVTCVDLMYWFPRWAGSVATSPREQRWLVAWLPFNDCVKLKDVARSCWHHREVIIDYNGSVVFVSSRQQERGGTSACSVLPPRPQI